MIIVVSIPYIYILNLKPLPLFGAQFFHIFTHCCGSMIVTLGSAISIFHILYVTKFEAVFSMDPHEVCRKTVIVLALLQLVPNAAVGIYNTFQGIHSVEGVAVLTKSEYNGNGVRFLTTYSVCCSLLFLILSSVAYVFIPIVLRSRQIVNIEQHTPQRTSSLQRYILGALGLFIVLIVSVALNSQSGRTTRPTSTTSYMALFAFDFFLFYLMTEKDVRAGIRRYIFNLLHIDDMYNTGLFFPQSNMDVTECLPQPGVASSSSVQAQNAIPLTTLITVSALRTDGD